MYVYILRASSLFLTAAAVNFAGIISLLGLASHIPYDCCHLYIQEFHHVSFHCLQGQLCQLGLLADM